MKGRRALLAVARIALIATLAGILPVCQARTDEVTVSVKLPNRYLILPNRLRVVLQPDEAFRRVVVNVRYGVGGRHDPPGRSGFAHLFEHLMFRGSTHLGGVDLDHELELASANDFNAVTTRDSTSYYESVPRQSLPQALWIEADRMASPLDRVTEEAFAAERKVVENERRQRYEEARYGHVGLALNAALFPVGHPYHRLPIGSPEELARGTLEEARAFAARHYRPSNATLVITGDFDDARAARLVASYFGAIPDSPAPPEPERPPLPVLKQSARIEMGARVPHALVAIGWVVPAAYSAQSWGLGYVRSYLDGLLEDKLVKGGLAEAVSVHVASGALASTFTVEVVLTSPEHVSKAIATVDGTLAIMTTPDRLWPIGDLHSAAIVSQLRVLANPVARAAHIQTSLAFLDTPDSAQAHLHVQESVTRDEVAELTSAYLADRPRVVVVVRPDTSAPPSGRVVP